MGRDAPDLGRILKFQLNLNGHTCLSVALDLAGSSY